MTEEEKRAAEDKARKDDDARKKADDDARKRMDENIDKLLKGMDSLCDRMDANEKRMDAMSDSRKDDAHKRDDDDAKRRADDAKHFTARKDDDDDDSYKSRHDAEEKELSEKLEKEGEAKELAADRAKRARKDAEEEDEKKMAADRKRKDDDAKRKADDDRRRADANAEIQRRIDAIEKMLPKERTDADLNVMTAAQAKADAVYRAFGKAAPRFLNGEDEMSYRRRLVREFQSHSPTWKPVDLSVINDAVAFSVAEEKIYADAMVAAMDSRGVEDGGLRMVPGETASGHKEFKFYGRPSAWMGRFAGSKRYATKINPLVKQEIA